MTWSDVRRARPGRSRRPAGFTLIELLVSVAIISVLISILLPALSGARKSSRGLLCQTRLRSQGRAMLFYAEAYESAVPLGESDNMHFAAALLPGLGHGGMNTVGAYFLRSGGQRQFLKLVGGMTQLQCPDFPNDAQRLDFVVNAFSRPYTRGDDAGQPGDGPLSDPSDDRTLFARVTRLKRSTSRLIFVTEAQKNLPTNTSLLHDVFAAVQLPLGAHPRIANDMRHPGGINALFFDTHVERMQHQRMDAGWPNPPGQRLRYFTIVP
jgi:prepilin-type N-terminal cleavage/methylation domain-containing protein/prepilin-type processing-associated H-X9-DG protein